MQQELENVIRSIRVLSPGDKLRLLSVITQDLQQHHHLTKSNAAFWSPPSLEQLIIDQNVPIVTDIALLGADFWPENETADDLNEYLLQRRNEE